MRRKKSRSRTILVGLLVLAFALMLIPTGERLGLRSQLLSALRPVIDLFPSQRARPDVAARNVGAETAPAQAPASTSETERQLRTELARLLDENQRLRAHLRAATPVRGMSAPAGVTASIITRDVLWEQSVYGLDRGTSDGVRVGSGVLYLGVAVGKVMAAAPQASCFAPITHPETRVAVRLTLCRAEGILQGGATVDGQPACILKVVATELNARVGEWVVTSGLDGSFPPGCWVGEVASVERRGNLEWSVTVHPACATSGLEAVYLLTAPPVQTPRPNRTGRQR